MPGIDLNRTSAGVVLPTAVSDEIWGKAVEDSFVMRAARRLPSVEAGGSTVHIVADDGDAEWIAQETDEKPVSNMTLNNKKITTYTIARILTFSNQFRRDLPALYNEIVPRAAASIGRTFDRTVMGYVAAPGSNFDTLAASPTADLGTAGDVYGNLLGAIGSVSSNGGTLDTWVLSQQGELLVMGETDTTGRPLFTASMNDEGMGSVGALAGARVIRSSHVYNNPGTGADVVGVGGSWQGDAVWVQAQPITVRVSDQATLTDGGTTLNLWQRNMFAVLIEAELGFRVSDPDRFVKLTGGTTA